MTLDQKEKQAVQQNEIDGIKDKLLEVRNDFYIDRTSIRESLSKFKEQEFKINDIISKTKQITSFFSNFKQFEDRIDSSL